MPGAADRPAAAAVPVDLVGVEATRLLGSSRAHSSVIRSEPRPCSASRAASSCVAGGEAVAVARGGTQPAASQPPQSDAGAAPSACKDEDAAPWITAPMVSGRRGTGDPRRRGGCHRSTAPAPWSGRGDDPATTTKPSRARSAAGHGDRPGRGAPRRVPGRRPRPDDVRACSSRNGWRDDDADLVVARYRARFDEHRARLRRLPVLGRASAPSPSAASGTCSWPSPRAAIRSREALASGSRVLFVAIPFAVWSWRWIERTDASDPVARGRDHATPSPTCCCGAAGSSAASGCCSYVYTVASVLSGESSATSASAANVAITAGITVPLGTGPSGSATASTDGDPAQQSGRRRRRPHRRHRTGVGGLVVEPRPQPGQHRDEGLRVLRPGDGEPPLDDEGGDGVDLELAGLGLAGSHLLAVAPVGQHGERLVAVEPDLGGEVGERLVAGDVAALLEVGAHERAASAAPGRARRRVSSAHSSNRWASKVLARRMPCPLEVDAHLGAGFADPPLDRPDRRARARTWP